jgi:hypothetical protein
LSELAGNKSKIDAPGELATPAAATHAPRDLGKFRSPRQQKLA